MKLYVNEKLLSVHNKFYVRDENNKEVYEISSKVISIGSKTTITDIKGNKITYIEQEILHLTPNYNVYIDDKFEFKITKKFQLLKNDYSLSNEYKVKGNFMMLDFTVYDDKNVEIGSIKRKYISIGDKYEIIINDTSKKELVLAIIVAIANDVNRNQNTSNN